MPERHRSQDGTQETEQFTHDEAAPSEGGRAGGEMERKVGTRDEKVRGVDDPEATTRVMKGDKKNDPDRGVKSNSGADDPKDHDGGSDR